MTAPAASWHSLAQRRWPRAEWIEGDGRWASVAHCRDLTVILHATAANAHAAVARIDRTACGGACSRHHEVVELVMPTPRRKQPPRSTA